MWRTANRATFNASHRSIKDAIKRATELEQALSEPRLRDLDRAREALRTAWPFLRGEFDVTEDLRAKATELDDLLARETFYRELPTIEQHASVIDAEYARLTWRQCRMSLDKTGIVRTNCGQWSATTNMPLASRMCDALRTAYRIAAA